MRRTTTLENGATWTTGRLPRSTEPVFTHRGVVVCESVTEASALFDKLVEEIEAGNLGPDAWVGWDEFLVTPTDWICTSSLVEQMREDRGCIARTSA